MFCKYCGVKLSENETLFCSSCEEIKGELDGAGFFYCSKEEARAAKRKKPFVKKFVACMLVSTVLSYGASFAFDLITSTL